MNNYEILRSHGLREIHPPRYYCNTIEIGFWEALRRFLKHWKWSWYKVTWREVNYGDSDYEKAPYEATFVTLDNCFHLETKS